MICFQKARRPRAGQTGFRKTVRDMKSRLWRLEKTVDSTAGLPLVEEIPYSRGNRAFVGCRGNLRKKAENVGES